MSSFLISCEIVFTLKVKHSVMSEFVSNGPILIIFHKSNFSSSAFFPLGKVRVYNEKGKGVRPLPIFH